MDVRTDPPAATDGIGLRVFFSKIAWTFLSLIGRPLVRKLYPRCVLSYFDVNESPGVHGYVALTIDDAFYRSGTSCSMVNDLLDVLREYQAQATFFTTLAFAKGAEEEAKQCIDHGHELGNHGAQDRSYARDSIESFRTAFDNTATFVERINTQHSMRWFRPPSGALSGNMLQVLQEKRAMPVLADVYVNDCHIPSPKFIGWVASRAATHGSIIALHMPERGFREWQLEAIGNVLRGLAYKRLSAVTLTQLHALSVAPSSQVAQARTKGSTKSVLPC